MIKVHIFHTGYVNVDCAIPYHEVNPLAVTGLFRSKEKRMTLPVSCYLIKHPKGNLLIDTGWNTKYSHERPHRFFGMLDKISTPIIQRNEGIDSKLKEVGMRSQAIDCVYFSHLDFDHVSGIPLLKETKHFCTSKEEIEDAKHNSLRYVKDCWKDVHLEMFQYENTGIGPVGRSYDVFKDGSVLLVNTPGHSHGHCSVKISGEDGQYIMLAGDSVYTQKSIQERIIPGFTVDKDLAYKSMQYICECFEDPKCVLIAMNHDSSIKEQLIEL